MPDTNTSQIAKRYYPRLSEIITVDDLPEFLTFVQDGLNAIFDKIHYKNLQYSKSYRGDGAFYSLDIVSKEKIGLSIPGGLRLVLNPYATDSTISSFPVMLEYQWEILGFLRSFNLDSFSFTIKDFYTTGLQIFRVSDAQIIANSLNFFTSPASPEITKFQQLAIDINDAFPAADFILPDNPTVDTIVSAINANIYLDSVPEVIFMAYILNADDENMHKKNLQQFFNIMVPDGIEAYIKKLIIPTARAAFELSAGLEFPREYLEPVYGPNGENPFGNPNPEHALDIIPPDANGAPRVTLLFGEAVFYANTVQGLGYSMEFVIKTSSYAQIGKTGIIIFIDNLKIDLSKDTNIPEADNDGRPADFIGVYAEELAVILPKKWFRKKDNQTLKISAKKLLVGTGGVSGTIALENINGAPTTENDYFSVNIGSWEVAFNYFDITFKQNVITQSSIAGRLKIPKLKDAQGNEALVYLKGHINEAGDFNLTASEPEGIPFTLFNFVTFNFLTLELGREENNFYIGTSCQIWFENQIMAKLIGDQIIEIPKLRVYDNGTIEIVGGNGFIPLNISLNLGPVEMAVTGVHYGATQLQYQNTMRKYNYWGFDGAISIDPLGIDVRGDGIKYYYTTDNDQFNDNGDSFIHIKTLEIDLVIPGSASPAAAIAIIHGMLSLPDPGESPEYVGEISIKLPKAKIAGGAAMKLAPRYPAFVIDTYIDLPAPIPIGPLGIYGFRGLLGFRYVAEKEAVGLVSGVDTWYDYYVHPPKGIHVSKFSGPERTAGYTAPVSLGAGAVLGTSFDSGTTISVRAMLLLSLPSLFMVEGKASIISARLGLDDNKEPPFFAFVAWGDNSIEMGMGADFSLPSSNGWILSLYAEVQSGFFFNSPSAWYVNFGTKENPISARVLTIVTAQTYLMLSAQGIETGARVQFDLKKRFGPAKVHLYAYLEIGGFVSFERPQMGGYIAAGGGIKIDIWIIGISITLNALLSAEAAKPFLLYAEISFRACARLGFIRACKSFTVKLKWEKDSSVNRAPIPPLPFTNTTDSTNRTKELVKGIHMLTNETFELDYLGISGPPSVNQITKVIPLDTYIEFKTVKSLLPGAISGKIGGYTFTPENCVDLIPPQKVVRGGRELRQVKHRYSIEDIEIRAYNGSSWSPYHPFEAVVDPTERPEVTDLRVGYWQIKEKQYDTIRILATTPFTYLESGEPGWYTPELYGITPSTLYCQETPRPQECANVLNKTLGTIYYPPVQYVGHFIDGAYFTLLYVPVYEIIDGQATLDQSEYMEVTNVQNVHGFAKSLTFNNENGLVIILPEASVKINLRLSSYAQGVTISYYKSLINNSTSIVQYELVSQEYKLASQLDMIIEYVNTNTAITKIVIKPDETNHQAIGLINEEIAMLFEQTYDNQQGEINIEEPSNIIRYRELIQLLKELESKGCSKAEGDCKRDPKLCDFYTSMLESFQRYFIYPVRKVSEIKQYQNNYNEFNINILNFDKNYPQYHLIEYMKALYELFVASLERLNLLLDNYPGSVSDNEIIKKYYQFRDYTIAILDYIKTRGNCDCDDNTKLNCTTSLQQVCWLSLENYEWNATIPGAAAIQEDFQDMTTAVKKIVQPIWRPDTSYYIKFRLKDEVDNGESNPGIYDYYYGFKTVGPIGHYHKAPDANYIPPGTKADEYALTSLRSYIDYNRSYPNADGNILKAKPLFYGNHECKISIYFNKPSTYHMFQKWHSYNNMPELNGELHIAIKDPVTNVVIPYPLPIDYHEDTVPVADSKNVWDVDNDPLLPPHIQMLNNIIKNAQLPCQIDLGTPIAPAGNYFTVTLTNLKPQKLYTALLYNAFEGNNNNMVNEPVHEFVFQTSRYLNFKSQVNSYLMVDDEGLQRQAVYELQLNLTSIAINKAWSIISNPAGQSSDVLGIKFQHLFDRIIEGVFQIIPTDPPTRTEFHKLINKNTGNIVAILIKNPEPFNNPKIPLENLGAMIGVVTNTGSSDNSYKTIYSKDYSQALIMNTTTKIIAPKLNFRFKYYTWNGSNYQETNNILIQNIIINE